MKPRDRPQHRDPRFQIWMTVHHRTVLDNVVHIRDWLSARSA